MRENNKLQNNGSWHESRLGKLTASRMAAAVNYLKNGQDSSERRKLKIEVLAERLTGNIVPKFVNEAMQWGIEHEPMAKERFESKTGMLVSDTGFIDHPSIDNLGCSPDGVVDDYSLIEVKCPTTGTYVKWLLEDVVPEEYKPQMILQCLVTGKRSVWFVAFDPRLPEKQQLFIKEFVPTKDELNWIQDEAIKFLEEVEDLFEQITTKGD